MKAPAFWWRQAPSLAARLLAPAGLAYGGIAARRLAGPGARPAIPVICVGNLVAGGAGKTPAALAIAGMLRCMGRKPAFLSRGYGGSLPGPLLVDVERHRADQVGDEPLLLARAAPAIVGRDRVAGAAFAAASGADTVVMDDGLQNPSLAKTFSLAVVDGDTGIGNGLCIPAGPLRAPLAAQWPRIDAVLLIGRGVAGEQVAAAARRAGKPVLRARLMPDEQAGLLVKGRRVLAFAGIGRPEKFFATLETLGADIVARHAYADHAPLTAAAAKALIEEARAGKLLLVTTEKDRMRMQGRADLGDLAAATAVLPVRLVLEDETALTAPMAAALNNTA